LGLISRSIVKGLRNYFIVIMVK